jgi:hypothetical protein
MHAAVRRHLESMSGTLHNPTTRSVYPAIWAAEPHYLTAHMCRYGRVRGLSETERSHGAAVLVRPWLPK